MQSRKGLLSIFDLGYWDYGLLLAIEQEGGFFLSRVKNGSVLPPQVASRVDLQGLQVLPQCRPHDFQKPPHHSKPTARLTCRTTRLCCHSPVRQRPAPSGPETRRLFPANRKDRGLVGQRLRTLLSRTQPHRLRKPCPAKSCCLSTKSLTPITDTEKSP